MTLEAGHRFNWSLGRGMSNFDVSRPFSGPNFRQENSTKSANSDMGCPYGGAQPGARRGHRQGLPRPRAQCTKTLARSWAKRRGAKLIVCLGEGFAPQGNHSSSPLRFDHDLAGVFVHWALGLGRPCQCPLRAPGCAPPKGRSTTKTDEQKSKND